MVRLLVFTGCLVAAAAASACSAAEASSRPVPVKIFERKLEDGSTLVVTRTRAAPTSAPAEPQRLRTSDKRELVLQTAIAKNRYTYTLLRSGEERQLWEEEQGTYADRPDRPANPLTLLDVQIEPDAMLVLKKVDAVSVLDVVSLQEPRSHLLAWQKLTGDSDAGVRITSGSLHGQLKDGTLTVILLNSASSARTLKQSYRVRWRGDTLVAEAITDE